jgi:hypothetical protein
MVRVKSKGTRPALRILDDYFIVFMSGDTKLYNFGMMNKAKLVNPGCYYKKSKPFVKLHSWRWRTRPAVYGLSKTRWILACHLKQASPLYHLQDFHCLNWSKSEINIFAIRRMKKVLNKIFLHYQRWPEVHRVCRVTQGADPSIV